MPLAIAKGLEQSGSLDEIQLGGFYVACEGILFGLLLSVMFTVVYFKMFIGPTRENVATGMSVIKAGFHLSVYWVTLAATMITSCLWAKALHLAFFERRRNF